MRSLTGWLTKCLPLVAWSGWLSNEGLPARVLARGWLERGRCTNDLKQECPRGPIHESWEVLMSVIIGVDPHKATHTVVAIDKAETEFARARVRATRKQVQQLLRWAEPLVERTWAVESAGGPVDDGPLTRARALAERGLDSKRILLGMKHRARSADRRSAGPPADHRRLDASAAGAAALVGQ